MRWPFVRTAVLSIQPATECIWSSSGMVYQVNPYSGIRRHKHNLRSQGTYSSGDLYANP